MSIIPCLIHNIMCMKRTQGGFAPAGAFYRFDIITFPVAYWFIALFHVLVQAYSRFRKKLSYR